MKLQIIFLCLTSLALSFARAETTMKVFGPGGPAPAMKKCASAFGKSKKVTVEVTAGPLEKWISESKTADLFYSGSENMMDTFSEKISELDKDTIQTHYIRPSAILVRPGNPRKIQGVKDLTAKGLKVMVVNGAGQIGMWEDILGRLQSVKALNQFRANIAVATSNTGEAEKKWNEDKSIDAWLVFNIWGTRNPDTALIIPTEPELTIYRSMGTAISKNTQQKKLVKDFVNYLSESECSKIFQNEGWSR